MTMVTAKTTATSYFSLWYELVDTKGFDLQAEQALADGAQEAYAICIALDGDEFNFKTIDEFKNALSAKKVDQDIHGRILSALRDEREIRDPGRIAKLILDEIEREKITEAQ